MKSMKSVLLLVLLFLAIVYCHEDHDHDHSHAHDHSHDDNDEVEITSVTCGSVIKLRHISSGYRLHSHKVSYGSGSGQQSITGFEGADDQNSFWVVKGPHGAHCPQGKAVKHGDTIRLQHLTSRKNLHSHTHRSPFTKQNEVSGYLEGDEGDTGDHWKVEMKSGSGEWLRDEPVYFLHVDTNSYLHANPAMKFQHPIPGQIEITGFTPKNNKDNEWKTEEGVYFPERKPEKE